MVENYPVKKHKFFRIYLSLTETEKIEFANFCRFKQSESKRDYENLLKSLINGDKILSVRTIWNRLSELTRKLEDFLLLKFMQKNKEERNIKLLEIFNARNIENIAESQYKIALKETEKQKFSSNTLYNLHRLNVEISSEHLHNNRYIKFVKHFRKHSEYFSLYFLTSLYTMQTEFSQQKLENIWHDWLANETLLNNLDSGRVIEEFNENLPESYTYLRYSYYLFRAYDDPDNTSYFFEAKKAFNELLPSLSKNFTDMAYQSFINYCINRTNNFDLSFNKVLFDIYNEKLGLGLDNDIRKRNYPTNNFRDYVIIGLRLKEYEWVNNFIDKYGKILPDDYKPDEENISRAMLYMAKNEYDKALKSLEKTRRKNYLHYADIAEIKLRIFYIKNNMLNAYDELARFEKYISSNEHIPRERRINYELFTKCYKRLLRLRENFSNDRLAKTELFIKKQSNFLRKNWIVEKLKELEK